MWRRGPWGRRGWSDWARASGQAAGQAAGARHGRWPDLIQGMSVERPPPQSLKSYSVKDYLRRVLKLSHLELTAKLQQEKVDRSDVELMELKGIAMYDLRVDPRHFKFLQGGVIEIRLCRDFESASKSLKNFRSGMMIWVTLEDRSCSSQDHHPELGIITRQSWCTVMGIVSSQESESLLVIVFSLANFLSQALGHGDEKAPRNRVFLQSRPYSSVDRQYRQVVDWVVRQELPDTPLLARLFRRPKPAVQSDPSEALARSRPADHIATELGQVEDPIQIIHGPPGTGKTRALAELICQATGRGQRVLALAPSHAACDALTLATARLWPADGGQLTRLGLTFKLSDSAVRAWLPLFSPQGAATLKALDRELRSLRIEILLRTSSQSKVKLLLREHIVSEQYKRHFHSLEQQVVAQSRVTFSTCHRIKEPWLQKLITQGHFDLICVDEAGFVLDHWLALPLVYAHRLVLAGDHCQLQPRMASDQYASHGLSHTLLERIIHTLPESVTWLGTQFRSNQAINGWSSGYFYDNRLKSHASVKHTLLSDLPGVKNTVETRTPLLFIDTRGHNFTEESTVPPNVRAEDADESFINFEEAFLVEQLVKKFLSLQVQASDIGIIAPYWEQVLVLRTVLRSRDHPESQKIKDIFTVDGFQGKEKELVIISLVRSNLKQEVGFLSDTRRINVAITRAKRCCIVIGDSDTLKSDPGLKSFIDYCQKRGALVPVSRVL